MFEPHHYHHAASVPIGIRSAVGHAAGDDLIRLVGDALGVPLSKTAKKAIKKHNDNAFWQLKPIAFSRKRNEPSLSSSDSDDDEDAKTSKRARKDGLRAAGLLREEVPKAMAMYATKVETPILAKSEHAAFVMGLDLEITILPDSRHPNPKIDPSDPTADIRYDTLVDLLVQHTEPAMPFDFLQVVNHEVRHSTLAKHTAQERSASDTPQVELFVEGVHDPPLAWSIPVDDDQWDTVAGRPLAKSKSKPEYWLASLLGLRAAAQKTSDQVEPRPARYYTDSQARICWVPSEDGKPEVKILLNIQAFVDLTISLEQHLGFSPRPGHIESDSFMLYTMFPPEPELQHRHLQEPKATGLRSFYDALSPSPPLGPSLQKAMQPPGLTATLLPFQLRSVAWLCFREGMKLEGYEGRPDSPLSTNVWEPIDLGPQGRFLFCRLTCEVKKDEADDVGQPVASAVDWRHVKGTLLSEEMGLGKTLEAIGVMMLHRHPMSGDRSPGGSGSKMTEGTRASYDALKEWDEESKLFVEVVDATLVVTPTNLLAQWIAEFKKHAPTMKICVYKGWRSLVPHEWSQRFDDDDMNTAGTTVIGAQGEMSSEPAKQRLFIDFVRKHDVVLTTYNALAEDATVAKAIAPRARRKHVEYREEERPRSPLVMAKWWRVCMDEVQMQNDRISADMVSLIPREFSLAISGTPAKRGTSDLVQTLRFLRIPVIPYAPKLWDKLQRPLYHAAFVELFSQIAVRTTKADVQGELTIPRQTRMVIPIELSSIEMHYYLETLDACRQALLVDDAGQPIGDTWQLDSGELRASLMRLRQICTHLQVGQLGKTADNGHLRIVLGRELMTMEAALDRMLFDHQQNLLVALRVKLSQSVRKAQLICMDDTDDLRLLNAGNIYSNVCLEAERAIAQCQETIKSLRITDDMAAMSGSSDDESEDDEDALDASEQEEERQRKARLTSATSSLRELSLVLHQATFFSGDVAHMKGDIDMENAFYAAADKQRSEILRSALLTAKRGTRAIKTSVDDFSMLEIDPREDETGIHSKATMENANHLVELLNDNAELIWNWRGKIVALLATPLEAPTVIVKAEVEPPEESGESKDDVEPEKDHYQIALEAQGEIEAYLAAYASALADRREMLMEERSLLQQHEARIQGRVITRFNPDEAVNDDIAQLLRELTAEREAIMKSRRNKKPLKAALLAFNEIRNRTDKKHELVIAESHAKWVRQTVLKQGSLVEKLLKEIDGLRSSFNTRVSYFAALQVVSDSVHAPTIEKSVEEDVAKLSTAIDESELQLARLAARTRYLRSLGKQQSEPDFTREDCVICYGASDAEHGCLLSCGHAFCKSCLQRHYRSPQGKTCPMCKMTIERRAISVFRYPRAGNEDGVIVVPASSAATAPTTPFVELDPETAAAAAVVKEDEGNQLQQELSQLRVLDEDQRAAIEECDMIGDFGSKINFLVKHLHYLATHEPDARHVVFSNWRDSLKIVAVALAQNGISYVSLDQGTRVTNVAEKFRTDKSISVFLLHAEKESAGLTLTAARMVHLLEPVLSHGFELQAIGRVDRLGQDHETTVFCYSTKDTVESRILARGIRNGDSIYLKDGVAVEQENVAPAAAKGGDANAGDARDLLELLC